MLSALGASDAKAASNHGETGGRAWRELELVVLILLVLGVYFSRLTVLTIRGEESRWARVAHEMMQSGDWIVPRQQGHPFPDRPPLNSWAMIAASKITGQLNLVAIRLPAVTATLLTTLLIYLYARNFLGRVGAFAGAAAYATMIQVMQLGRMAESDPLLTLCVSAALFAWHWSYACRSDAKLAWVFGYALAALAGLAKGPQGPIYFVAITTAYLCLRRDWRFLFNRWHLVGLSAFALVLGSWQLPFLMSLDAESVQKIWSEGGEISSRFQYPSVAKALSRWLSYPVEVWACMLPWSFLLPVLASGWFRQRVGQAAPMVSFLLTACAVTFPTCWLPADSRARYFMSLYPCVAPLMGTVIERSWEARDDGMWQRSWDRFLRVAMWLIPVSAVGLVGATVVGGTVLAEFKGALSVPLVLLYAAASAGVFAAIVWSRNNRGPVPAQVGVLSVACMLGLGYTGLVVNLQRTITNDPSAEVVSVRDMIPPGEQLVSYGPVHHLFAYYYHVPIELEPLVDFEAPADSGANYFCFSEDPGFPKTKIPFEWEELAVISCDRARSGRPMAKVIVGKRKWDVRNVNYTSNEDETCCCQAENASETATLEEPAAKDLKR